MARSVARLSGLADVAPVVVRVVIGAMIATHGWQKLDAGVAGFAGFLDSLGVPSPDAAAWAVTLLELVGGILLIVGLLSRLVALLLIAELVGAVYLVTWNLGLIADAAEPGVGYERDLAYMLAFLVVLLLGPGKPSVDHLLRIERVVPAFAGTRTRAASGQPAPGLEHRDPDDGRRQT